jgi:energy-coupling factor transporter ATP-binding protein EcfA2
MKQRVGIARALSIEPKIMLMDEPFSALDALTRGTLQDEVRRICMETGQTVFMIAHDVDEAIYLADRVLLMTNGPNWANDNWAEELAHGRVEPNRGPLQAVPGVIPESGGLDIVGTVQAVARVDHDGGGILRRGVTFCAASWQGLSSPLWRPAGLGSPRAFSQP